MDRLWRSAKQVASVTIFLASLPLLLPSISIVAFVGFTLLFHVFCGAMGIAFLRGLVAALTNSSCNFDDRHQNPLQKLRNRGLVIEKFRPPALILVDSNDEFCENFQNFVQGFTQQPEKIPPCVHDEVPIDDREVEVHEVQDKEIRCALDMNIPSCLEKTDIPRQPAEDSPLRIGEMEAKECMKVVEFCLAQSRGGNYYEFDDVAYHGSDHGSYLGTVEDEYGNYGEDSVFQEFIRQESSASSSLFSPRSVSGLESFEASSSSSSNTPGSDVVINSKTPSTHKSENIGKNFYGDCNSVMKKIKKKKKICSRTMEEKALSIEDFIKNHNLLLQQEGVDVSSLSQFAQLLRFWRAKEQGMDLIASRKNLFMEP